MRQMRRRWQAGRHPEGHLTSIPVTLDTTQRKGESMSQQTNPTPVAPEQEPARQPYTPPRLVRYGTVAAVTQGRVSVLPGDGISAIP
jgi:hypothetical protein